MVLAGLAPLIIGAAFDPVWFVSALPLLRGEGGVSRTAAFASGAMVVRLLQGAVFGSVFDAAADASGEKGAGIIASTLLLVVGILLLITAVKSWRKEDDPDAPPPKFVVTLQQLSGLKAFGMGMLVMVIATKQWFFTLSAIAVIDEAQLGQTRSLLTYLFFAVAAQAPVLVSVVASAVSPTQMTAMLDAVHGWLKRNKRGLTVSVSSLFGAWLFWNGITGLLG